MCSKFKTGSEKRIVLMSTYKRYLNYIFIIIYCNYISKVGLVEKIILKFSTLSNTFKLI